GAEYDHYTADITRTFPVNGKFSREQAEIYQIVYDAQEAAARELKPGAKVADAANAARQVIVEGLFRLGLITDKKNSQQYRLWYLHGWGHWLGMNVHDVGNYNVTLAEGMMMTNEPGIYIRENSLELLPETEEWQAFKEKVGPVFEKYKNIGVRIEDDMLITKTGVEWMSKDLPRSIGDVENFMAGAKKEMDRYAVRKTLKDEPESNVFALNDFLPTGNRFDMKSGESRRSMVDRNGKTLFVRTHL
ncbi:MAG: M24 family metallopeptidase, partial [Acidobacteriota bacterium]|nr:M24 family metallopeptidase [Acidobacteriota bacterium]